MPRRRNKGQFRRLHSILQARRAAHWLNRLMLVNQKAFARAMRAGPEGAAVPKMQKATELEGLEQRR